MWRESGTVGARISWNAAVRPSASAESAADGRRRDRIEDAEQGVAVALAVAGDQLGVVEVVAGVHAHARGQAGAQQDLLVLVEQRQLDAVDLGGVVRDDADADVHRGHVVGLPK